MQDDGKYASRFSAKPSGVLCAVLPITITFVANLLKLCSEIADLESSTFGEVYQDFPKNRHKSVSARILALCISKIILRLF